MCWILDRKFPFAEHLVARMRLCSPSFHELPLHYTSTSILTPTNCKCLWWMPVNLALCKPHASFHDVTISCWNPAALFLYWCDLNTMLKPHKYVQNTKLKGLLWDHRAHLMRVFNDLKWNDCCFKQHGIHWNTTEIQYLRMDQGIRHIQHFRMPPKKSSGSTTGSKSSNPKMKTLQLTQIAP